MGGGLGLAVAGLYPQLSEAHVTLWFPPPLQFSRQAPAGEKKEPRQQAGYNPATWARETLTGKEAIDVLCKRIERSESEGKEKALRAAVLLLESKRLQVEALPNSCVRLKVYAESPVTAQVLCDGLLAYLTYKTKIPLEDPEAETLRQVEQQLRVQEKSLGNGLWTLLAFDGSKSRDNAGLNGLALDLEDYGATVEKYREASYSHFFRETREAGSGPGFTVLEPAFALRARPNYLLACALGGGLGFSLSWLLGFATEVSRKKRNFLEQKSHGSSFPRPRLLIDSQSQRTPDNGE